MATITIKRLPLKYNPSSDIEREINKLIAPAKKQVSSLTFSESRSLLRKLLPKCNFCDLNNVYGPVLTSKDVQNPKALFIGRNPCKGDNRLADVLSPEVPDGQVFDKYLKTLNLVRGQVYVTNVVMCHTCKNVPPTTRHCNVCSGWKKLEFQGMQFPRFVFLMGNDALRMFFGENFPSVNSVYGDIYLSEFHGVETLFIPIQHPGFIVRHPEEASNTLVMLQTVADMMENPNKYNLEWSYDEN